MGLLGGWADFPVFSNEATLDLNDLLRINRSTRPPWTIRSINYNAQAGGVEEEGLKETTYWLQGRLSPEGSGLRLSVPVTKDGALIGLIGDSHPVAVTGQGFFSGDSR